MVFIGPMVPGEPAALGSGWRLLFAPAREWFTQRPPITTRGWGKATRTTGRTAATPTSSSGGRRGCCPSRTRRSRSRTRSRGRSKPTADARGEHAGPLAAPATRRDQTELAKRVRCPVLVIHGTKDRITPYADGKALAKITGGRLETVEGAGHLPHARKPVQVNLAMREFVDGTPRRDPTVHRSDGRKRALYISSPIGLGHAQRDVAIARELRNLVDGLEIDWLAQDPVTRVLEGEGERIHPGSEHLANESRHMHMESESAEHDLHCFQAWRRMDEILINNFMVFHDVAREERYDLWIGDEAWELDYYLHENPREKRARYGWLTDFVGWLPMPDGGDREAYLTADYNAEMVEHIAAHPTLRDRAIFVGNPDDIVDERLGPQLPMIRDWTERNFEFAGYVTGFDPRGLGDRDAAA